MDGAPGEIVRHILVPHPYGRPTAVLGAALRASKIAPGDFVELGFARVLHLAPNKPSNKKAPLCGAILLDGAPGEIRTPDRSVRSLNCELVILYKSKTCDLDQSRYVVMKSVNEPYLVMCWYIIATYE